MAYTVTVQTTFATAAQAQTFGEDLCSACGVTPDAVTTPAMPGNVRVALAGLDNSALALVLCALDEDDRVFGYRVDGGPSEAETLPTVQAARDAVASVPDDSTWCTLFEGVQAKRVGGFVTLSVPGGGDGGDYTGITAVVAEATGRTVDAGFEDDGSGREWWVVRAAGR